MCCNVFVIDEIHNDSSFSMYTTGRNKNAVNWYRKEKEERTSSDYNSIEEVSEFDLLSHSATIRYLK